MEEASPHSDHPGTREWGNVTATDVECEDEWPGPRAMVFEPSVEEPE
jgi:hypothetical protein